MGRDQPIIEPTRAQLDAFYVSREWRLIRYKALKRYGKTCHVCGAVPDDGVLIVVDHIKPVRHFWGLRLNIDNLQILCEPCNLGKGSWDKTDHRPRSVGEVLFGTEITESKTRLKRTLIDQHSEGLMTEEELTDAIRANGLRHA